MASEVTVEKGKKEKKGFKIKFLPLLMAFGIIPLLVSAIIICVFSVSTLEKEIEKSEFEKLKVAATDLASYYEWDIVNEGGVTYEHDYVDSLKDQGIELTVFEGDTRLMTSIVDASTGKRNEGTQASAEIAAKVLGGADFSDKNVKIGSGEYYVYYTPLQGANGESWGMAFAGISENEIVNLINATMRSIIIIAVVVLVIFAVAIVLIANYIKKPMIAAVDALSVLAGGDISSAIELSSVVVELDQIAEAAKNLQGALNKSISGVKRTAGTLDTSVQEVDTLSESSAEGAGNINMAVGELATTAQSMAESVQDVNAQVIEMGNNITEIADNVRNLTAASENIQRANDDAKNYMDTVLVSSNESVSAVRDMTTQIENTNTAINKIGEAVEIILGIAEQTELLSLNAAIEAARAGDAGRGFAVVADSISQLSQQSADGANEIKTIADEMVAMSAVTVKQADAISKTIEKERQFIKETQQRFEILNTEVGNSIKEIEGISAKTDILERVKDGITANISDLSAISEENAASNQEVTASVENIAAAIADTKEHSGEMREMSEELRALVEYFK